MITEKQIREIVLGPRQILLFDFENDTQAEQDQLLAWIFENDDIHLGVELETFLQSSAESLNWPVYKILQHLFWLAYDLQLHFRQDGCIIAPRKAKQILLESLAVGLQVVLRKPVADSVFESVQQFVIEICDDADCVEGHNQSGVARWLVRQIDTWRQRLHACRMIAQQPGFPGVDDIDAASAVIDSITFKWDPFSLIHIFHANREQISQLVHQVKTLSRFYLNDGDRWQTLIGYFNEMRNTLFSVLDNVDADVVAACEKWHQIMTSPQPYDQVDEAFRLLNIVKPHHDRIVAEQTAQYRQKSQAKVESLIQQMKQHLLKHAVSKDLHNQALYGLQTKISAMDQAGSMAAIQILLQAAEDHFDLSWETVVGAIDSQKD